ncbi:Uu.00g069870.m01.CDS01 [Anthostomella pinea]|uniref:Uu.00g069870.m01.CDS01 n=1 Tax=Anthostomella pinea TaxID=933095 RepID=A0AAI8VUK4_9PEZI|nr:Uu.00g069870.m01.CDS01 [Anthostomella pinea]
MASNLSAPALVAPVQPSTPSISLQTARLEKASAPTDLPPREKLPAASPAPDLATLRQLTHASALTRIRAKIQHGAFVAEAGNFAAVACWEPLSVQKPLVTDLNEGDTSRPLFAGFARAIEGMVAEHLRPVAERVSEGRYWHLSLMARDPEVEYVPGAVRAVLAPFMRRFVEREIEVEGGMAIGPAPVWLEAGSERARDVYAHFGFRVVDAVETAGVKTWGMIYTGDSRVEDDGVA